MAHLVYVGRPPCVIRAFLKIKRSHECRFCRWKRGERGERALMRSDTAAVLKTNLRPATPRVCAVFFDRFCFYLPAFLAVRLVL